MCCGKKWLSLNMCFWFCCRLWSGNDFRPHASVFHKNLLSWFLNVPLAALEMLFVVWGRQAERKSPKMQLLIIHIKRSSSSKCSPISRIILLPTVWDQAVSNSEKSCSRTTMEKQNKTTNKNKTKKPPHNYKQQHQEPQQQKHTSFFVLMMRCLWEPGQSAF